MKAVKKIGYIALLLMALFVLGACAEAKNDPGTTVDETSDPSETPADENSDDENSDDEQETSQVGNIYFVPTNNQLSSSDPNDFVALTVKVVDQDNILLEGVYVQFSADNDGILEIINSTTDSAGSAEANLSSPSNSTSREIMVTATVETADGEISDSILIEVTDAEPIAPNEPSIALTMVQASDDTATSTVTKGNPALVTAAVKNAHGQALNGEVVTFTTGLGILNPSSGTVLTDADGNATIELAAGDIIGADIITASALIGSTQVGTSIGYEIGAPDVMIGGGTPFVEGTLEIGVNTLAAGGTTSIEARLVDSEEEPIDFPVEINFNSEFAQLTPSGAEIDAHVTSIAGVATGTYTAMGTQSGTDTITATATIGGLSLTASAQIEILTADAGSIEFVSADPTNIRLKGMGGTESSKVRFQVRDIYGNPSPNQDVNFSLNTAVGGLELDPNSATSNAEGEVHTTVKAGTIGTAVRVTAELDSDPQIKTQSEQLVVSTGIPDQDSFSLSIETFNPEAYNTDGVQVAVTVHAADRFNNPVPDGTAIYFTTEGGAIEPSCLTEGGKCSVNWNSQNPRPEWLGNPDPKAPDSPDDPPFPVPGGGRSTLLAHAIGEESFLDLNGNGVFDDGDTFDDLPEAFRDDNESGTRDTFEEPFIDFNENGVYDTGDGLYNGLLCEHSTLCSDVTTTHVRGQGVIVMSTSEAYIEISPGSLTMDTDAIESITVDVWDLSGNQMPAGTTIELSSTTGSIETSSSFTVPNTTSLGPKTIGALFKAGDEADTGVFTTKVTSPGGVVTESSIPITVTEAP